MLCNFKNFFNIYFQKLLSSFVVLFCFLLFPIFLIFISFDAYYAFDIDNFRQIKIAEINKNLEYLNRYSNNKRYLHLLLSKISEYAQKENNPIKYLKKNIDNLKIKYPNCFQFIIWDKDGKVVNEISDKAGYSYILNKLYDCLYEVTKAVNLNPVIKINDIETVKKNINILNNFLGNIFIPENLKRPLSKDTNSGPLFTDVGKDFPFVWFSINDKVSFLCFISNDFIHDFSGLKKISEILNKNTDIIYGFSKSPNYEKSYSKFPIRFESELALALSTFENGGDSLWENEKALVKMSMPQPNVRTFGYFVKNSEKWNYKDKRNYLVLILSILLMLFYSLLGFWFIIKRHYFSISRKLTILFIIANLVPISILGFITNRYITNKSLSLKNEITDELARTMREFDLKYNYMFDSYSSKVNSLLKNISEDIGNKPIKENDIKRLTSLYEDIMASSFYLIASSGKIISYKKTNTNSGFSMDFISSMGFVSLNYLNNIEIKTNRKDVFSSVFRPQSSEFYKYFLKNIGKIEEFFLGNIKQLFFFYTFGRKDIYNNNYLLTFMWNMEVFQNLFLKDNFKFIYKSFPEADFCIKSNTGKNFYGTLELETYLNSILDKYIGKQEKITGCIGFKGEKYLFLCLNGTNLEDWIMMAVYPEKLINKKINNNIIQVFVGALISILLTIIIGQLLVLQFLKPIHYIGEAANAIKERNFSYSVPIVDKDEFGRLNQVFNRVIEGLGDFEVAKIVQESLLPENHFIAGDFDIFARTVVMTTLGGDYYDCFKINDDYLGIIIGDVAGHGIPAGLMMAMAKSAVLSAPEEVKLDPTALTIRLHKMFYSIKNDRLKRMMTFQYFVLNIKEGHFIYTNAGHCFPIIVDKSLNKASFIEYIATPLGIGSKCRCKNNEFYLNKGQSLVLYTDGIVEANNTNKEQFGYDRFLKCLPEYYDIVAENFYYNLYNKVYKNWISEVDDDLTLILINRK